MEKIDIVPKLIKGQILRLLQQEPYHENTAIEHLKMIEEIPADEIYSYLFDVLIDISFDEETAKTHYENIATQRKNMQEILGRDVGFYVVMLDYFLNGDTILENPKIVELSNYELKTRLILVDELTGIYNRRYFEEALTKEIQRASRHDGTCSLLFIDIDDFKKVNDTHGHCVGDEVLREFAAVLAGTIRAVDVAARFGGEEFAVLMPETNRKGAIILAERLLDRIREHRFAKDLRISFSGGIATFPEDGTTTECLIKKADEGLYGAKRKGKNQVALRPQDKRAFPRYSVYTEVFFGHGGTWQKAAFTENISLGGTSFTTDRRLDVGEKLDLKLRIPGNGCIALKGDVVWKKSVSEAHPTFTLGLAFENVNDDVRLKLNQSFLTLSEGQ